jgi:hypothetical protein
MGDTVGLRSAFFWAAIISLAAIPMVLLLPQLDGDEN